MNTSEANMQQEHTGDTMEQHMEDSVLNSDDNIAGTHNLQDPIAEISPVETLEKELEAQKDKYVRLFAEFDNYKRRTARERIELMQTAGREIITALLDVLDDCDRTEKVLESGTDLEAIKQGVNLVFHKLRNTLEQKGLKTMQSLHAEFDADLHEAITEIPAPDGNLQGKVLDELQKGYMLGDKIIRYAKVVVGK